MGYPRYAVTVTWKGGDLKEVYDASEVRVASGVLIVKDFKRQGDDVEYGIPLGNVLVYKIEPRS